MIYIYDVLLNWFKKGKIMESFEWNTNDEIDHVKKIETKTGKEMCFVTGSDELNTLDMVLFPIAYQKMPLIEAGMLVRVRGHVEKRFDKYQLVVQQIQKVSE